MRIALVGCGYVADFYGKTLPNHSQLEVTGVFDRNPDRAKAHAAFHGFRRYESLDALLADPAVELVVNLTNPGSHHEVSRAALEAGKHVYSEKPLAMKVEHARGLVELAERKGLLIAGAPCSVLGEAAQTAWKAVRDGALGTVRLAYAEIDDGPVHLMGCTGWRSASGAPWPAKDEFEVGATLEHAGYYVTWLCAMFGPAVHITSAAECLVPDKGVPVDRITPDFTVATLRFASGAVARLTCSIFAPHDHALRLVGDEGVLRVEECWDYGSRVELGKRTRLGLKAEKRPRLARLVGLGPRALKLLRKPGFGLRAPGANQMDYARGIAEMADAVRERRPCRLSARFSLHVNEVVLAIQDGLTGPIASTFEPMAPMPWAG